MTDLGQIAYDTYCKTRDWKSFNGDPLPQWPDVKPDIQQSWRTAAEAVLDAAMRADAIPRILAGRPVFAVYRQQGQSVCDVENCSAEAHYDIYELQGMAPVRLQKPHPQGFSNSFKRNWHWCGHCNPTDQMLKGLKAEP